MIPQATVDHILETARIEEVVSDFVTLRRRGASLVACCPFHNEKTPSFYVTPSKGIFKCFGCQKAGSAVGFVMEYEHCSYVDALKYLAKKYHIEVEEREDNPEEIAAKQHKESLMLTMEFSQNFLVNSLHTPEGESYGLAYLHSRGLDDETIERFGIGWAPMNRTALTDAAKAASYKMEYMIESGMCSQYDDGKVLDRFHERVMFPIHSLSGRVIAYSGRTLRSDGSVAKYVNSSETPLYVKSNSLFGIYLAKGEISKCNRCYLAEGNVDVVTMHQTGIRNVVASCGTSLTEEQILVIKKFTDNVTVMYDGDKAGIHAAQRAIGMILKEGMNVSALLFPDGDDPDSFCRKHTLEEVRTFISENEMDFVSYMIKVNPVGPDEPLKRAELINLVSDAISNIPDAVRRTVFVDSAADRLNVDASILYQRINSNRLRSQEERMREEEREKRRVEAGLQPKNTERKDDRVKYELENNIVAQTERDLLNFILTHGTDELDFASDSEFFSGDEQQKPTVADFIRCSLEDDNVELINSAYRQTYNAYFKEYDAGCSQEDILRILFNSPDQIVAFVSAELSVEKYQLSVRNFENSLTTTSSWLVNFVPKALLAYADKRIEDRIDILMKELKYNPENVENILESLQNLKSTQRIVKVKLGRDK